MTGAACALGTPIFSPSRPSSVIVIGAGAFGGWTALRLVQNGLHVRLLDAWGPGNSRASSGGETRTIRATYGPAHPLYTHMVARALQLWQEFEQQSNSKLFFRSGALRMAGADDSYESAALPILQQAGIRFEKLSAAECAKRWPQINFEGVLWSVHEPESGFLAARRACEVVLDTFVKAGGKYQEANVVSVQLGSNRMEGIRTNVGPVLRADAYVFALGPWLGQVFPFLAKSITPTRQEVFFFGTPPGDTRFNLAPSPATPRRLRGRLLRGGECDERDQHRRNHGNLREFGVRHPFPFVQAGMFLCAPAPPIKVGEILLRN